MKNSALLAHGNRFSPRVDVLYVEPSDSRPAHSGFNESVNYRAVPICPISFPPRPPLLSSIPIPILRLSPNPQEKVRRIEHLPPLLHSERSIDLERVPDCERLNFCHRFIERKRKNLVNPLRKRLQMSNHSVDTFIREPPPPVLLLYFLTERIDERPRETR